MQGLRESIRAAEGRGHAGGPLGEERRASPVAVVVPSAIGTRFEEPDGLARKSALIGVITVGALAGETFAQGAGHDRSVGITKPIEVAVEVRDEGLVDRTVAVVVAPIAPLLCAGAVTGVLVVAVVGVLDKPEGHGACRAGFVGRAESVAVSIRIIRPQGALVVADAQDLILTAARPSAGVADAAGGTEHIAKGHAIGVQRRAPAADVAAAVAEALGRVLGDADGDAIGTIAAGATGRRREHRRTAAGVSLRRLRALQHPATASPNASGATRVARYAGEQAAASAIVDLGGSEARERVGARTTEDPVPARSAPGPRRSVERKGATASILPRRAALHPPVRRADLDAAIARGTERCIEGLAPTAGVRRTIAVADDVAITATAPHAIAPARRAGCTIEDATASAEVGAELGIGAHGTLPAIADDDALLAGPACAPGWRLQPRICVAAAGVRAGGATHHSVRTVAGVDPVEAGVVDLRVEDFTPAALVAWARPLALQRACLRAHPDSAARAARTARLGE